MPVRTGWGGGAPPHIPACGGTGPTTLLSTPPPPYTLHYNNYDIYELTSQPLTCLPLNKTQDEWPLLCIVPASLRLLWAEELEKWLPHLRPSDIHVIEGKANRLTGRAARGQARGGGEGRWRGLERGEEG